MRETLAKSGFKNEGLILKVLVIIIGVISVFPVYILEKLGGILSVGIALMSIANGSLLGMFLLGLFFPRGNSMVTQTKNVRI